MTYSAELIDHNELVHTWLLSIPELVTAAPGGIYGPPGLPSEWTPDRGSSIMFLDGQFQGDVDTPIARTQYRFNVYGFDNIAARILFRKLYRNIHRARAVRVAITGGYGVIMYSEMVTGPNPQTDPSSGWMYDWATFQIQMAENLVS